MRRGMSNLHVLKVRRYAAHVIEINKYLYLFPGGISNETIGLTELNEILLNSMPNS